MKVSPNDIRYMVIIPKTTITNSGPIVTPHVYTQGHLTRADADDKRPANGKSKVVGYVSNHRRQVQD